MAENVYLVGAETVQTAASSIRRSADQMEHAASSFGEHVRMLSTALDEHATRVERAAEAKPPVEAPLTLLDRFALAATPALIAMRKETTTFAEDISDAYTFSEIALKFHAERFGGTAATSPAWCLRAPGCLLNADHSTETACVTEVPNG